MKYQIKTPGLDIKFAQWLEVELNDFHRLQCFRLDSIGLSVAWVDWVDGVSHFVDGLPSFTFNTSKEADVYLYEVQKELAEIYLKINVEKQVEIGKQMMAPELRRDNLIINFIPVYDMKTGVYWTDVATRCNELAEQNYEIVSATTEQTSERYSILYRTKPDLNKAML